jgi:DNA-binding response OmpR family regulator
VGKRILLVDDEPLILKGLKYTLEQEGYETDSAMDGEEALAKFDSSAFDLILLDVMLPGVNGFDLMEYIRPLSIPVIFLTAMSSVENRVHGLKLGADDYLTKPFMTKELLARLRALGRRSLPTNDGSLTYGDLTLDVKNAALKCSNGQSVRLGEKELRILEYLIANQGQVLSREQIALKIWGYESDAEYNNVEVYMSFVRKKLAFVETRCEIKAIRGLGYELRCRDVQ